MKKLISFLGVLVLAAGVLVFAPSAEAAVTVTAATGGTAISADTVGGAWTSLGTITIAGGAANDFAVSVTSQTLIITAPTGFEFNTAQTPSINTTNGDFSALTVATPAATTITVTYSTGAGAVTEQIVLGATTAIQVRPTAKNLPTGNILRTATGGSGAIDGLPAAGSTVNLGTLTQVPGPITILSCISSGSAGAVWLRWTNPGGDPKTVYDVRRSLALINDGNYSAATAFTQTWPVATEGAISQQLVTALATNQTHFFAMKSNSANGLGAISTVVNCVAPTASVTAADAIKPTSALTALTSNQGIKAGEAFMIKGGSSDTGGSSVRSVEVSVDSGTTWHLATAKTSTVAGFSWEYVWSNPIVGSYTVKTRATDWFGNMEVPGAGVTVGVVTTLPTFTAELGVPLTTPVPTPALVPIALPYVTPITPAQISANITALQSQLLVLLQQLLAILQAQIGAR